PVGSLRVSRPLTLTVPPFSTSKEALPLLVEPMASPAVFQVEPVPLTAAVPTPLVLEAINEPLPNVLTTPPSRMLRVPVPRAPTVMLVDVRFDAAPVTVRVPLPGL